MKQEHECNNITELVSINEPSTTAAVVLVSRVDSAEIASQFTARVRRDRSALPDKWHLDEVVIPINSTRHWLWREIDANGDVLDILVQPRRDTAAAKPFMRKLVNRWRLPRVLVTVCGV